MFGRFFRSISEVLLRIRLARPPRKKQCIISRNYTIELLSMRCAILTTLRTPAAAGYKGTAFFYIRFAHSKKSSGYFGIFLRQIIKPKLATITYLCRSVLFWLPFSFITIGARDERHLILSSVRNRRTKDDTELFIKTKG